MSISLIEEFVVGIDHFNDYENDRKTQSAVERQLGIIGEALTKLRKFEPAILIENDRQIIGFRNRIIHAYDSVDNSIVWAIIKRHLKNLKNDVLLLITD